MDIVELLEEISAFGLKQGEISKRSGLSQPYISQLANGERGQRVTVRTQDALQTLHDELCAERERERKQTRASARASM